MTSGPAALRGHHSPLQGWQALRAAPPASLRQPSHTFRCVSCEALRQGTQAARRKRKLLQPKPTALPPDRRLSRDADLQAPTTQLCPAHNEGGVQKGALELKGVRAPAGWTQRRASQFAGQVACGSVLAAMEARQRGAVPSTALPAGSMCAAPRSLLRVPSLMTSYCRSGGFMNQKEHSRGRVRDTSRHVTPPAGRRPGSGPLGSRPHRDSAEGSSNTERGCGRQR